MGIVKRIFGGLKRRPLQERTAAELLVYLDAAYMLARWLTEDECAAEDAVQEAFLSASRDDAGATRLDARVRLLTIVRNTCLDRRKRDQLMVRRESRPRRHSGDCAETVRVRDRNAPSLEDAVYDLAPEFREVLLLRELQELSYREISMIVGVPADTVMSRLTRARVRLEQTFIQTQNRNSHEPVADEHN